MTRKVCNLSELFGRTDGKNESSRSSAPNNVEKTKYRLAEYCNNSKEPILFMLEKCHDFVIHILHHKISF